MKPNIPSPVRDVRLDFFRGVAMLIILIAHIPGNKLSKFIPARFGYSDATEMFVFLSGFAAAIAFGGSFRRAGFGIGSARIAYRCWQLYISHLMLFFAILTICVIGNFWLNADTGIDYIGRLALYRFINSTESALAGLFTLTYVPNFFDIMPMYIGALALVPAMMLLARAHPWLALAFSLGLYLAMWVLELEFTADTRSGRPWFFNPFGWQLLFFSGYALSSGWIKPPPPSKILFWVCVIFVVACIPLRHYPTFKHEWFLPLHDLLKPYGSKTNFGPLRWLHFMALAYITVTLLRGREHVLNGGWAKPIVKTGQNALPVFLLSMMLAVIGGMALDVFGRGWGSVLSINLIGALILISAAYMFGWFRSAPWKRRPPPAETSPAAVASPAPAAIGQPTPTG